MELTIAFQGDKSLYAQSPDPSTFFRVKGVACETTPDPPPPLLLTSHPSTTTGTASTTQAIPT